MADIDILKNRLRESEMPMFFDDELEHILKSAKSLDEATYNAAIIKSKNTQLAISGLTTNDTSKYFLRLASLYRPVNTGVI